MDRMTAVCGLDCAVCDARLATQANDEAAKERIAAQWRERWKVPSIDTAFVTCDGCLTPDGRLGGHCTQCEIRACGVKRELPNCAHCTDYDSCDKLAGFFNLAPEVRAALEEIRGTL